MSNVRRTRTTATKRDLLTADLERDPTQTSKRPHLASQALSSHTTQNSLQRALHAAEAANAKLESTLREAQAQISRLEQDRRVLADQREMEVARVEEEGRGHAQKALELEREVRGLRGAVSALREEAADREEALAHEQRTREKAEAQCTLLDARCSALQNRCEQVEAELADTQRKAHQRAETITDLETRLDMTASSPQPNHSNDDVLLYAALQSQHATLHSQYTTLQSQHSNLQSQHTRLRAQLRTERCARAVLDEEHAGRLRVVDSLRARLEHLESTAAAQPNKTSDPKSNANTTEGSPRGGDVSPPRMSTLSTLSALRLAHARLLEEHGETKARLAIATAQLEHARSGQSEHDATRAQLDASRTQLDVAHTQLDATQAQLEAMRAQMETAQLPQGDPQSTIHQHDASVVAPDIVSSLQSTVSALQTKLTQAQATITAHERTIARHEPTAAALQSQLSQAQSQLSKVESTHEHTAEQLADAHFALAHAVYAGQMVPPVPGFSVPGFSVPAPFPEDSPSGASSSSNAATEPAVPAPTRIRVLCLRDNPAQRWADERAGEVARLRAENRALLVSGGGGVQGRGEDAQQQNQGDSAHVQGPVRNDDQVVPRESWDVLDREKCELEEALKGKEKRLLRLQQVFTSKSAEFREAIAAILGVKLAFYPNGQVRVTSMYDLSASFVFQPAPRGGSGGGTNTAEGTGAKMQLIAQGAGGPQDLPQLLRYWVDEEGCIPGFLASVTLECYDRARAGGGDASGGVES
ncbi:mitotic checkpoint protein-domain-containing protein [Hygrophoropsis aurantiaca]|uniref:Mitotic checkpoint protein-domain-containing protein n=1 Tax=Hygrophoropsis aurantiaca TaxID=72124 RepID=A0ACB8A3T2_9AGAM|nr:mitotic checkpoint protein-domain-containing protein [Hygrophoropsis aurantiaca]